MLGLIGTVGGAAALEMRRWRNKGSVEELRQLKRKERELRDQLEATEREKEELQAKAASLGQQKEQLQQTNTQLVLSNLMLLNKAKNLEDNSRALIAKQEDLQHQLEQVRRDQVAAEESFESALASLKEAVTGVLNRYFSKDIQLEQAMGEMQALGIEVVPLEQLQQGHGGDQALEFETKLVLESPHRMQRLMAATMKALPANHDSDVPRLAQMSFPMGVSKDPATGAPRITLAWRTDPQVGGGSPAKGRITDTQQQPLDQQPAPSRQGPGAAIKVGASAGAIKAAPASSSGSGIAGDGGAPPAAFEGDVGQQALTLSSPQKQAKRKQGGGFSLGFGGLSIRASGSGGGGGGKGKALDGPALLGGPAADDDLFVGAGGKALQLGGRR